MTRWNNERLHISREALRFVNGSQLEQRAATGSSLRVFSIKTSAPLVKASRGSGQQVGGLVGSVPRLQSSPYVLPEDSCVSTSLRPAQVGASLHQLPHAVVRRQLMSRDVLQKQQDQHVLLLIKQTEAATDHRGRFRGLHQCERLTHKSWRCWVCEDTQMLYITLIIHLFMTVIMFQLLLTHLCIYLHIYKGCVVLGRLLDHCH